MDDRLHFSLYLPLIIPLVGINIDWSHVRIGWLQAYPLTFLKQTFYGCGTKFTTDSIKMSCYYYIAISNLLSRVNNDVVTVKDIIFNHGIAFNEQHKSFLREKMLLSLYGAHNCLLRSCSNSKWTGKRRIKPVLYQFNTTTRVMDTLNIAFFFKSFEMIRNVTKGFHSKLLAHFAIRWRPTVISFHV